jgi:3-hydroxyisobutyrate dehydrogenase-like beta-hydroxyacid dehydrogenase
MADTIVVIAAGEMGAGIGKRLSERGARVLTSMKGRSADSKSRAAAAGMQDIASDDEMVAQADFILSVVPPKDAAALAERLKGPLAKAARKPIYVDCNAIAPKSAIRIGEILGASGAPYVDGGIIGGPPGGDYTPSIYVSGKQANDVKRLDAYGLNIRVVKGDIGAASAMKMSYAGITKGVTAIGAALLLGAARAGCAEELKQELFDSQPQLAQRFSRQIPAAFPKAYRWVAEMEEIAAFLGDDPAASEMFLGIAKLYARIASGQDKTSPKAVAELADLMSFCSAPAKAGTGG